MSGPSYRGLIQHARRLLDAATARAVLALSAAETLQFTGASRVVTSYGVPGQGWEHRSYVLQPENAEEDTARIRSALFAVHRRLAVERAPIVLRRSEGQEALFAALAPAATTIFAFPIVHRTGKLVGEMCISRPALDELDPETQAIASELAQLAAAALENAQRLAFARRDQERLQLFAEASDEVVWDWNLDTKELWWGGRIAKFLGRGALPVRGESDWKVERIHPQDRDRVERSFALALASPGMASWKEEYRFFRADNSTIIVEDRAYFLRETDGRAYRAVGALRDITTLKTLFERERVARAEAESANRTKDDFLAMLGHELRNPLAPIATAVEVLRLRNIPQIEREREIIARQSENLTRLVDDLLDVARASTGKIELHKQRVELSEILLRALETTRNALDDRRHRLVLDVPNKGLALDADPARFTQIVGNLISNAAKYTEPGGTVTIAARRDGGRIVLEVRDTGIGIEPHMLSRVFDMFVQERQAIDRAKGGLGLGLSIVRSLVELHGGTVEARSAGRNCGSTFVVHMPAADEQRPGAVPSIHASTEARAGDKGLRILVVDDNVDAAQLLSEYFSEKGNTTWMAHDGAAAISAALEATPDVVLLDIGLPVVDGYEVATQLRQKYGLKNTRLIAITGYGQESDKQRAKEAGFDAHLVKPVNIGRLEQTIQALISKK